LVVDDLTDTVAIGYQRGQEEKGAAMTIVDTTAGQVRGRDHRGVIRFAGIPFAAPPLGALRFRAPEPHPAWAGVRDALEPGPTSIQNAMLMDQFLGVASEPQDEDCLFLNVFTPAADGARRPVMVWIHGGAFVMGSGSSMMYDASTLVERGDVVVVTINYRLGALGFLHLAGLDAAYAGSGNNGILDQIAALEWVRDNIADFGGDPGNVTIFGESAGGMSVGTLLGTPRAAGLFHKAILQSGAAHNVSSPERAGEVTERFMGLVGASTLDHLLDISTDSVLDAQLKFLVEAFTATDAQLVTGDPVHIPFEPVHDGVVLPRPPIDAIAAGSAAGVPVLVGTTRDEWNLFAFLDQEPVHDDLLIDRLERVSGDGEEAAEVYREAFPDGPPKARFGAAVTDYVFRQPAIRLAERLSENGSPAFMYLFAWASPAFGGVLGSCHALDVPFVFGNLDAPGLAMLLGGDGGPDGLAGAMMDSWLGFARSGDPSHRGLPAWPRYDPDRRATMVFDRTPTVIDDPESARRRFWADRL
jgi:para-nitrobenzyl esterase